MAFSLRRAAAQMRSWSGRIRASSNDAPAPTHCEASRVLLEEPGAWLAAIIENSEDAVLSKTLDGVITSWNGGAQRLFGFSAEEAIGQPITIIIPEDRLAEELEILQRLRAGRRIKNFETVRRRKDGQLVDISLTVSPVKNSAGAILGASKIARDFTAQKRARMQQELLLREMHHRTKNIFSLTAGLISLSAREARHVEDLAADLSARLHALARAHELTLPNISGDMRSQTATSVRALLNALFAPHELDAHSRIVISGDDAQIAGNALTSIALLLHELTTNSVKHGALSVPEGRLVVTLSTVGQDLHVDWSETGRAPDTSSEREGFGARLQEAALYDLAGRVTRNWTADGLAVSLQMPLERLKA